MLRKLFALFVVQVFIMIPGLGVAGSTSGSVYLEIIRPVSLPDGSSFVIIHTAGDVVCGTSAFKIDLNAPTGKELFSLALAAQLAGKMIQIEIVDSGCTGWGSTVKSLYLTRQ